jgi:hypothetical protein
MIGRGQGIERCDLGTMHFVTTLRLRQGDVIATFLDHTIQCRRVL